MPAANLPVSVPSTGLEPAAYRLGGRASLLASGLVSALVRDEDFSSSHTRPTQAQ